MSKVRYKSIPSSDELSSTVRLLRDKMEVEGRIRHVHKGPWWDCEECCSSSTYGFRLAGEGWTPKGSD